MYLFDKEFVVGTISKYSLSFFFVFLFLLSKKQEKMTTLASLRWGGGT